MSNAGQAVLGIVGGIIGFYLGGPTGALYGFQLGVGAGTLLFPTQLPGVQGPRIADGQQTASTVGQPIPWLVGGTDSVGGIIIWASPIREVASTETVGGKGAPEQDVTTYHYYRSWAILLSEGPIGGIRRVWANGKCVYDKSIPSTYTLPEIIASGPFSAIMQQFVAQIAKTRELALKMTIYRGTEDQMPDPTMESFLGVGNVPAMRGYAYVVFNDVELKPEDGNRIPAQWKFEIFEEGEEDDGLVEEFSNEVLLPWRSSGIDPRQPNGAYKYIIYSAGLNPYNGIIGEEYSTLSAALGRIESTRGEAYSEFQGYTVGSEVQTTFTTGAVVSSAPPVGRSQDWTSVIMHYNSQNPNLGYQGFEGEVTQPCCDDFARLGFNENAVGYQLWAYACFADQAGGIGGIYKCVSPLSSVTPEFDFRIFCCNPMSVNCYGVPSELGWHVDYKSDVGVRIVRQTQPPGDPCDRADAVPLPGYTSVCVVDGRIVLAGDWTYDATRTFKVLSKVTGLTDGSTLVQRYPLNPVLVAGHPLYNDQDFWESAYNVAVAQGWAPSGWTYGVEYPQTQNYAYVRNVDYSVIDTAQVSLARLVERICERVGVPAIDVSDLEDVYVIGYQIARPMPARAGIDPLRSVGFFDVVESGIELKFPRRGKAPVVQLEYDDLGAHFIGEERPPLSTSERAQEVELPQQIRVHYKNALRNYDPGEELSPARFDTEAKTVADLELAVAMLPTMAAQSAEVIFRDLWAARTSHGTALDISQGALEAADPIVLPIDDQYQRVRIVGVTEKLPNLRVIELVRDDDGSYTSSAVGTDPGSSPTPIEVFGPVEGLFLDLPALDDAHDDAGFYVAARPQIRNGLFRGALIQRSIDGGASWTTIGSAVDASAMGRIVLDVEPGPTEVFDYGNEIRVELYEGALESRDIEDVLAGANAAAIGADGRWEIVQFANAELLAGTVYSLTTLLRGRRGTEHAVASTVANDRFVLLSSGSLVRVLASVADLNGPIKYRISAIGTSPELVTPFEFTAHGIALKPFSPVHIEGARDTSSNLTISWLRRDRLQITELDPVMSEDVEDYEVDILDSEGAVVRTISTSTTSTVYSASEQITDFGSVQAAIAVRVYQISVQVGRGYPGEAEV